MNDNTGEVLYKHMVTDGMSIIWIEKEYGVSKRYIIERVYGYMHYLIKQGKLKG